MRKRYGLISLLLVCFILAAAGISCGAQAPPKQEPPAFTFAVFGDNRPGSANLPQPDAFRDVLKGIRTYDPAFVVNTGDCIYGSSSLTKVQGQYKDYAATISAILTQKVYLAIGNHETQGNKDSEAFFAKEIGGLYYSFDRGDSHFIVLDSSKIGEDSKITGDQLEWLKQDLQKSRAARHKFVFVHMPLYPVDGHRGSSLDMYPKERDALHGLFVRNRITAVFVGHEHLFNVQKKNGVIYVITGGGGAFTFPSTEGEGDFHHFVLVSVNGDKVEMTLVKSAQNGKPSEVLPVSQFLKE